MFYHTPVSGGERSRRTQGSIAAECTHNNNPARYLLTFEQMIENEYPIPSYLGSIFRRPEGWIETSRAADAEGSQAVYAIDCEMCVTRNGKELTRVCVIDFDTGEVVYHQLVKPSNAILDYRTPYSGITAAMLRHVTTTLADVQKHLGTLIKSSTILLSHSLEKDLHVLRLAHPRCIDTALLFDHQRGPPFKPGLAWLTRNYLGRRIQDHGPRGHDPEEDARACIDLLKAKMRNGQGYGEFRTNYDDPLMDFALTPFLDF